LNNFWQKRGKKVPDKNMNANLEPEDPNEGSQRGGNSANSDPEVAGVEAVETAKLVGELDDLRQTLLRRQADFENYRKRTEKERAEDSKRATARVIEGLIPVIDGFEHALAAQGQKDYENYRRGFELIYRQLVENVTKLGAERIDPVGKQFDPHQHQAMDRLETTEHEDGTVVHTFQPGYVFHGRVLRPAMVRVAVEATPASKKTVN
jgi:molecular chaperone GrpE